jgi:hypothetical protein
MMKILILGLGKSGTTALLHKVAAGLPDCRAFSGGAPGKYIGDYANAVYKHTYSERKGKSFDVYREHLRKEHYDRKIWVARDPRDAAVSRMLYRWHRGNIGRRDQYHAHLQLVRRKEQSPRSISFCEICRYAVHGAWPGTTAAVAANERARYREMYDFVKALGDEWFVFNYEDMVDNNFGSLEQYLGFAVSAGSEVPRLYSKVVRRKSYGDWRHWFTEADIELLKPAYLPYLELTGYASDDWALDPAPVIEPRFSSEYMQHLPERATLDAVLRYKDRMLRGLRKRLAQVI